MILDSFEGPSHFLKMANITGIVSLLFGVLSFLYFIVLTCFRLFSCETTTLFGSFKEGGRSFLLLVTSYYAYKLEKVHWQCVHFAIMLGAYVLARTLYRKYVVGKPFKKVDLTGKVFIVTGANAGIGFETAKQFILMGGTVVMACRSMEKGAEAREEIMKISKCSPSRLILLKLDLCDFDSVRQFVKDFEKLSFPLHVLVNNAGVMMQERTLTKAGLETVITANHLSHFLLTNLLLPHIEKTEGRIVNVSSSTHHLAKRFNFDDIMSEKYYELFHTYAQSKLANILFTRELQKRLSTKKSNVKCFSLHPGLVRTEVTRNMSDFMQIGNKLAEPIMKTLQKTPEEGAYCSVHVATSKELDELEGGEYFMNGDQAPISAGALNSEDAVKLWEVSEKLVGAKF